MYFWPKSSRLRRDFFIKKSKNAKIESFLGKKGGPKSGFLPQNRKKPENDPQKGVFLPVTFEAMAIGKFGPKWDQKGGNFPPFSGPISRGFSIESQKRPKTAFFGQNTPKKRRVIKTDLSLFESPLST